MLYPYVKDCFFQVDYNRLAHTHTTNNAVYVCVLVVIFNLKILNIDFCATFLAPCSPSHLGHLFLAYLPFPLCLPQHLY